MRTIKLTDEQLAEIAQAQLDGEEFCINIKAHKSEKVELEGGEWWFNVPGRVERYHSTEETRTNGAERKTEELAIQASKRMVRANRLEALVTQVDPDYKWWIEKKDNYYISNYKKIWGVYKQDYTCNPCTVYMTQKTAKIICAMLNEKRFVL